MRNTIARIIQATWKDYRHKLAPDGPNKRVITIERNEKRLVTFFMVMGQAINDTLEARAKRLILAFFRGTFFMLDF
jgi:hypothetical protein